MNTIRQKEKKQIQSSKFVYLIDMLIYNIISNKKKQASIEQSNNTKVKLIDIMRSLRKK